MKNKSGSRIKRLVTRIFNYRTWSDWDRTKSVLYYIKTIMAQLFIPQPKKDVESFGDVVVRLQLTDSELLARQRGLFKLCLTMVGMALLLLGYAVYQFMYGSVLGGILSLVVMSIAGVLAFRYHFWYFQIKTRKLGCTIHEWFHQGLLGEKQ